ncbi:hypothetical protein ACGF0D_10560 [Kitasatospora sp. NPDC048298]|uniref:hypothetical protein n=1 Tax=Kitasatospora sp. NPDC048298 TaxID=3364049 RepID=UPI003714F9E3
MTDTPPSLRDRIDATIRPRMLIGLQDAELYDQPGRERIGEWADSITEWVLAVVQPELDDARDRTLTEAAELIMRDAEEQYQRSYSDNKIFRFNGAKRSADLLLAARTTTT